MGKVLSLLFSESFIFVSQSFLPHINYIYVDVFRSPKFTYFMYWNAVCRYFSLVSVYSVSNSCHSFLEAVY
jgi:hypothetical protein